MTDAVGPNKIGTAKFIDGPIAGRTQEFTGEVPSDALYVQEDGGGITVYRAKRIDIGHGPQWVYALCDSGAGDSVTCTIQVIDEAAADPVYMAFLADRAHQAIADQCTSAGLEPACVTVRVCNPQPSDPPGVTVFEWRAVAMPDGWDDD